MSIYKFSDGTEYHLSGQIQKEERIDGWYVVANDYATKVKDEAKADHYIKLYNRDRYKYFNIQGEEI